MKYLILFLLPTFVFGACIKGTLHPNHYFNTQEIAYYKDSQCLIKQERPITYHYFRFPERYMSDKMSDKISTKKTQSQKVQEMIEQLNQAQNLLLNLQRSLPR